MLPQELYGILISLGAAPGLLVTSDLGVTSGSIQELTTTLRMFPFGFLIASMPYSLYFLPEGKLVVSETLYHRDHALLYIAYVMHIWAAPIPADRWHCSLWP